MRFNYHLDSITTQNIITIEMLYNQSQIPKLCPHFATLPLNTRHQKSLQSFIKPNMKGWLCLYVDIKQSRMVVQTNNVHPPKQNNNQKVPTSTTLELEVDHKIFMEMNTLQIYCFQCNIQITDQYQTNTKQIRKSAIVQDKEQDKVLFGSNIEYSEGFVKDKAGFAGTKGTELNSFINSSIQLLSNISPLYQIIQDTDLSTLKNQFLKHLFTTICKIRSGLYRIVQTKDIQTSLLKQNPLFYKYSNKTPNKFIQQVLTIFNNQFQYQGPQCLSNLIIQPVSPDIFHTLTSVKTTHYSPKKQLFTGEFVTVGKCSVCQQQKTIITQFEYIALQQPKKSDSKVPKLQQLLLTSALNLQLSAPKILSKITCSHPSKKHNSKNLKYLPSKSKIIPPNILIFYLGANQQGINIQYPNLLNLSNFIKSSDQQYKYEYIGSIVRLNKKYLTHIRLSKQSNYQSCLYNDVIIKYLHQKPSSKIKLLIYKIQPLSSNKQLSKNIFSSILVDVQNYIPLPDFWIFYLSSLRSIQHLINPFICPHGYLLPDIKSKSKTLKKIPPPIYQYLLQKFGGYSTKISKNQQYCQKCLKIISTIKQIKRSQKQIVKFADQLSNNKSKYLIYIQWFNNWKTYLYKPLDIPYQTQASFLRPPPIANKLSLTLNGYLDQKQYKKVSPQIWYYFHKFYGVGKLALTNKPLLSPCLAIIQAVDLKYQKTKQLIDIAYGNSHLQDEELSLQ